MTTNEPKMDCESFRREAGGNPADVSGALERHAENCAACRAYRDRLLSFDQTLAKAMSIPVPALRMPQLPDIESGDNVVTLRERRKSVPTWFGIAAGFALAAYFGLLMLSPGEPELTLAEQVIAHMDYEQASRVVTDVAVPEQTLDSVVSKDVAQMDRGIGLITYAHSCVINGNTIPHLVVQGQNGPVTLLLLPDEKIDAAITLHGENISGVILPMNDGSIAIVGSNNDDVTEIGDRVIDSVKWST